MVKFKVPLGDILGRAYYQYELSSSNYNPHIDETITITCTCKNILGNPIPNKELTLMMNGVEQGTSTTNANGIATWSITFDDWGNKHFYIGNATLDLVVTGWKQVATKTVSGVTYTITVNGQGLAKLSVTCSNVSFNNGSSHEATNWIPSAYLPSTVPGIILVNRSMNNNIMIYFFKNGAVGVTNTYTSTQTVNLNHQFLYCYI